MSPYPLQRCWRSRRRRWSRCGRCSWHHSYGKAIIILAQAFAAKAPASQYVPLLVGEYVAANLLLLLLDKVDVRKHAVGLECGRQLRCTQCQSGGARNMLWLHAPAVTALRWRPANEISWRTNLRTTLIRVEPNTRRDSYPSLPRSQTKFFKVASENPWPSQLKLGLRL